MGARFDRIREENQVSSPEQQWPSTRVTVHAERLLASLVEYETSRLTPPTASGSCAVP